jgi:UDP-xylose/UDP-N-acetylglucosamine transporter B4
MLFGYFFLKKLYTPAQIVRFLNYLLAAFIPIVLQTSVFLVSIGVILTTLSRPNGPSKRTSDDLKQYIIGISMLTISSLLTGILGMLQELTYRKYGPCWREGMFYTVNLIFYATNFVIDYWYGA